MKKGILKHKKIFRKALEQKKLILVHWSKSDITEYFYKDNVLYYCHRDFTLNDKVETSTIELDVWIDFIFTVVYSAPWEFEVIPEGYSEICKVLSKEELESI